MTQKTMPRRAPTDEAYAELQQAYDHFNGALFNGALPQCLITLQREKRTCGYFSPERFISLDGRTHGRDRAEPGAVRRRPDHRDHADFVS